jgi:hypothetical protein
VSGTSVPYHLRQNKYVERHVFVDLLGYLDRWQPLDEYLYVGFGAIYFEDFKLLHSHFAMKRMLSIEKEEWVLPRQKLNVPYGCVDHEHCDSSEFIQNLDTYRRKYRAKNLLVWLDYAGGLEIAAQLNDVKALVPSLLANDILKVTFEAEPNELASRTDGADKEVFDARLEKLRNLLGTQFLPDGISPKQMTEEEYPAVLCEAFKRVVAGAMRESPGLIFQPIGSYVYKDTSQMITITGILLDRTETEGFWKTTEIKDFDLAGLSWELQRIEVPDLSLREKFLLDQVIFNRTAEQVEKKIGITFARDRDQSLKMIENYMKFYRYYPNFYPVVV